jgi:VanZ family protein
MQNVISIFIEFQHIYQPVKDNFISNLIINFISVFS